MTASRAPLLSAAPSTKTLCVWQKQCLVAPSGRLPAALHFPALLSTSSQSHFLIMLALKV